MGTTILAAERVGSKLYRRQASYVFKKRKCIPVFPCVTFEASSLYLPAERILTCGPSLTIFPLCRSCDSKHCNGRILFPHCSAILNISIFRYRSQTITKHRPNAHTLEIVYEGRRGRRGVVTDTTKSFTILSEFRATLALFP